MARVLTKERSAHTLPAAAVPGLWRRLPALVWVVWALAFVALYYKQLWLVLRDPATSPLFQPIDRLPALAGLGDTPWTLPAGAEAAQRAALGILGASLVLLAACALGAAVCRLLRWSPANWREGFLYRQGIGLGGLAYLFYGLSALEQYRPEILRLVVTLLAVLSAAGFLISLVPSRRRASSPRFNRAILAPAPLWQLIALAAILVAFVGALAPEQEFDALWYHLYYPKLSLRAGFLVDLPSDYVSLYPMTWELLFGGAMAFGGPVAAKLVHFSMLPLIALAVYQVARRWLSRPTAWLTVALLLTMPTVLWEATTAYIDLSVAYYSALAVYGLLRYLDRPQYSWLLLTAVCLGLGLATKHLQFFVLLLCSAGLFVTLLRREGRLGHAFSVTAVVVVVAMLIPLPWYLRSWYASGNPVFPELFGLFGAPPDRWDAMTQTAIQAQKDRFGLPRTPFNLLTLPWDLTFHAARYGGSFGPIVLLFLPALVLPPRSRPTRWLTLFCALYLLLWASPVSSYQLRYLVPIAPLLALLSADGCSRIARSLRSWHARAPACLLGATALLLILNLPPFISLHERDRVGWTGWLTHVVREIPLGVVVGRETQDAYLTRVLPSYQAWRYINERLPDNARVLSFSSGDQLYAERDRIWSDATMTRPAVWGAPLGREQQALATIERLGITHVLVDKRQVAQLPPGALTIADPAGLAASFAILYEDDRFILYAFRSS